MDVKLNEVWVLVIRVSLCEIYHQRLSSSGYQRPQGTNTNSAHTVKISC